MYETKDSRFFYRVLTNSISNNGFYVNLESK